MAVTVHSLISEPEVLTPLIPKHAIRHDPEPVQLSSSQRNSLKNCLDLRAGRFPRGFPNKIPNQFSCSPFDKCAQHIICCLISLPWKF